LLTDTVGFIQKLPTDLVAAFRATLEEVTEADVILHVVDSSHPQVEEQAEAVEDELESLGALSKPRITVLNKSDQASPQRLSVLQKLVPDPVVTSALERTGLEHLRECIAETVAKQFVKVSVDIPYTAAEFVGLFRSRGMIEHEDHKGDGTHITGRLPATLLPSFQRFIS
jgi:GTP-binding protein HflX